MPSSTLIDPFAMPGMGTPVESSDTEIFAGRIDDIILKGIVIDSTAVDSGNTPTTTLRRGLPMGKITSTGQYGNYDPTATDGRALCLGLLYQEVNMLDSSGAAADKAGRLVVWAFDIKAAQCPATLDALARRQLAGRIWFDDDNWQSGNGGAFSTVVAKTANYTVLPADNNALFTNQGAVGAVTFTLPTIARGLRYRFFAEAGQALTVASVVADTMVVFNDAAADSISFSTAAEIIGGGMEVIANADATRWLVFVNLGAETQTPVIAT